MVGRGRHRNWQTLVGHRKELELCLKDMKDFNKQRKERLFHTKKKAQGVNGSKYKAYSGKSDSSI